METEDSSPTVGSDLPSPVYLVAAHLALVVAVIHLTMGLFDWFRYMSVGIYIPPDPRILPFVASGVAVVLGMLLAAQGRYRRPLYAGGIVVMVGYILGYFSWHWNGHHSLIPFNQRTQHEGPLLSFFIEHLFAGTVEFLALASEFALAVVLLYLLIKESR